MLEILTTNLHPVITIDDEVVDDFWRTSDGMRGQLPMNRNFASRL
jgi:hypothetical protein